MIERKKEEEVIVLDFLQNGYPFDKRPMHLKTPVAQGIGTSKFSILEIVPRKGIFLQPYERVYIGEGKRDKIHHINGRIEVKKLTHTARSELIHVVTDLVKENEQRFVEFFNKAQPISTRMHVLELLPGVGKKHRDEILMERKVEDFTSFADMKKKVKLMPDPITAVVKRIMSELEGKEKYYLFTEKPSDNKNTDM
jgi:putative nucleotide binding protein